MRKATAPALWVTVDQVGVGRYQVRFPLAASLNGVAHVTTVDNAPRWWQVVSNVAAGPDHMVIVQCYRPGGVPDNARFVVDYTSASGMLPPGSDAFGYVRANPVGAMRSSYNSIGAGNAVTQLGTGFYEVKLNGLGTALLDGNLQATAEHPFNPRRCKIAQWSPLRLPAEFALRRVDQLQLRRWGQQHRGLRRRAVPGDTAVGGCSGEHRAGHRARHQPGLLQPADTVGAVR
ncbi:hypothetical protein [Micromonospora sp. LOL_015]|uniref:hypothetical protein n=1 Tax=Micromonospora sp. LOL_015 TaxID=3345416 RepID=UPI003A84DF99